MSSSFSTPIFPAEDIVAFFHERGVAPISTDDLAAPSSEFVCSLYSSILAVLLDDSAFDADRQLDFGALELLHNPDHHLDSLGRSLLFRTLRSFTRAINFYDLVLKDLMLPDPRRTAHILSSIVNFLLHRDEKMDMLQPIVEQIPGFEEKRAQLEAKRSEMDQEAFEYEEARKAEQPLVEELQAEVKELKQTIHSWNNKQMSLKIRARELKENDEAINSKISQIDFELVKNAQERSNLMAKVVQSPDKLQRAVEEKKLLKTEEVNAEKSAMLGFKETSAKLEVYSKVCEKMSRHSGKMKALQEQVNSMKALDKDVKALKARLSDDEILNRTLEAQIVEVQGKVIEAEDLLKEMEKAKGAKFAEHTKTHESAKLEIEGKMHAIKKRELDAEAMVLKGENNCRELESVKESRRIQENEILAKSEEVVDEYHKYVNSMNPVLQRIADISIAIEDHEDVKTWEFSSGI